MWLPHPHLKYFDKMRDSVSMDFYFPAQGCRSVLSTYLKAVFQAQGSVFALWSNTELLLSAHTNSLSEGFSVVTLTHMAENKSSLL